MKLTVKRIALRETYTIGRLYINGEYFCDTLEDRVRNLQKEPKVKGQTAIPTGTYQVTFTYSPKFAVKPKYAEFLHNGLMPLVNNVPQFSAIRIHGGNTAADSDGCILVGANTIVGRLTNSLNCFKKLYKKMYDAYTQGERITLTIS